MVWNFSNTKMIRENHPAQLCMVMRSFFGTTNIQITLKIGWGNTIFARSGYELPLNL